MIEFQLRSYNAYGWKDLGYGMKELIGSPTFILAGSDGNWYTFELNEGLRWKGISVPKVLQWCLPDEDHMGLIYTAAGMLRAYCYGSRCLPKEKADNLFRDVLRAAHIPKIKELVACYCARHFGREEYGKNRGIRFYGKLRMHSI